MLARQSLLDLKRPAFASGLRAALEQLAPALLGQDATQINQVYRTMDEALYGHGYAKAAIDIACWDLLGQHCAQPISALLGGRYQNKIPAYASIPLRDSREMLKTLNKEGTTIIQVTHSEEKARYGNRTIHLLDGWVDTEQAN